MTNEQEYNNVLIVRSEVELPDVARQLLEAHPDSRIFAFYGAMGAGKTTFIKAICRELGITDEALSPSFAIINEYRSVTGSPVYHFDFYRIKRLEEAYDTGAKTLVSACPFCEQNLGDNAKRTYDRFGIGVKDIMELVHQAM